MIVASLRQIPLIVRLALTLAAAALLPVVISGYQLRSNRDAMLGQVQRTHLVAAETTAARLAASLGRLRAAAMALADHPLMRDDPGAPAAQELLRGTLQAEPSVIVIALLTADGRERIRAQRRDLKDVVADLVRVDPDSARGPTLVHRADGSWLRLDLVTGDEPGDRLLLIADARSLTEMVGVLALGDEADVGLLGAGGDLLVGDASRLGALPDNVREGLLSGRLGAGAGKHRRPEGDDVILAHAPVAGTGWTVVSQQSARIAEQAQSRMRRATAVGVVGALLLTLVLSAVAYGTLVRPLREVIRAQRALAGMEEEPAVGSEIDQLKASFTLLEQRLKSREDLEEVFLGRYQVRSIAGAGSNGAVFRGWDPQLERPVALKTIRLDRRKGNRRKLNESLVKEAIAHARFNHPNIVTIYDAAQADEAAYVAMELVDGTSLATWIHQRAPLPVDQVVIIGLAIAHALEAAHGQDLIHQDIKPGNVLLGIDGAIKVTDFGVSQIASLAVTEDEVIAGTPGYMAPERLRGEGYSSSTDLFALGCVLFEALTGRPPFRGRNAREVLQRTLDQAAVSMARLRPDAPRELATLVDRLLSKEPADRPRTAVAVAEVLDALRLHLDARWDVEVVSSLGTLGPTTVQTRPVTTRDLGGSAPS